MIQMISENVRIRSDDNIDPTNNDHDIFVEVLINGQWIVEHSYNSLFSVQAHKHAQELVLSLLTK
jgi:hypothetical protein